MTSFRKPAHLTGADPANTENRMRQALGLAGSSTTPQQHSDASRQRHRFVTDGEVPVVMLNRQSAQAESPRSRIAAIEAALAAERRARSEAERALEEAHTLIQSLRTTLAHAELAHGEALAAERVAREQAQVALQVAIADRETAEQKVAAAVPPAGSDRKAPTAPKPRKPQPVKWWLPASRRGGKTRP
jgi:hypothetical protein